MAYTISSQLQLALDSLERTSAVLLTFTLGENTYGLWTGLGELSYGGITYRAGGSVIEVSDLNTAADGSVTEVTLSLSTSPDKGLTSDILQSFYEEDWQFGRVVIQLAILDPETYEPIGTVLFLRGTIYEAPYHRSPSKDTIELRIVSQSIKMSESGGGYRNAATQKLFDTNDTSLVEIGSLGSSVIKELKWGQQ